jgi:DNA repair protein RadD
MTPRPYQLAAIEAARACYGQGAKAVLVVSPTGSGKTYMMSLIAQGHLARRETNRVVWLAHRSELLDQAAATLRGLGLDVGLRGTGRTARVQVESIQTILARGTAPEGSLLIADEAHHFAESNRCGDVVKLYPLVLGATATPERGDCKPLKPPFDALVVASQIGQLTADGHLVPLKIKCPATVVGSKKIAQRPVDAYLEHARGMRAICFAPNLRAAEAYMLDFRGLGVVAMTVSGKTPRDEREGILAAHKAGKIDVLVNCGVLTEGYDDPQVSCILVARGCGSQGLWLQMTGRGLRPAPDKTHCLLIDLRGLTHELGRPDADRDFALDGDAIQVHERLPAHGERLCRICHAPLGDLVKCPECGGETSYVPESANVKLVDEETIRREVREQMGVNKLVIALAGMLRKAAVRQVTASIGARFRGIFRHYPSEKTLMQANEYNRVLGAEVARAEEERHRDGHLTRA